MILFIVDFKLGLRAIFLQDVSEEMHVAVTKSFCCNVAIGGNLMLGPNMENFPVCDKILLHICILGKLHLL